MKKSILIKKVSLIIFVVLMTSCSIVGVLLNQTAFSQQEQEKPEIYSIYYSAIYSTSGSVPVDYGSYENGSHTKVQGNGYLEREGYTFIGWTTTPDGLGQVYREGDILSFSSTSYTLYAKWGECKITYFTSIYTSGSDPIDNSSYEDGSYVTVLGPGDLKREGYTFIGWTTSYNGLGQVYKEGDLIQLTSTQTTLYAKWGEYKLTYHALYYTSGSVPVDNCSYESGSYTTVLGIGDLKREGYTFIGWTTSYNGLGQIYYSGDLFEVSYIHQDLYAKWIKL